jgi:hypothetical protein
MADAEMTELGRRDATGVLPVDAEWDRAQQVYDRAAARLAELDGARVGSTVPDVLRDAVGTLGDLLGIWHGYGEDDDG